MSEGLATTFEVLAKIKNEAAVETLIAGLDSPLAAVQDGALSSLLARRSVAGGRELLRRLHTMPQRWKDIIRENQGRMTRTLRDAVLTPDRQTCRNACQAAVWFHEYDLIPILLNVLEDQEQQNADLAAGALLELSERLYDELAAPRNYRDRRDPQLVRRHVIGSLESAVNRYGRHKHREVVEAFLLLVKRDNAALKHVIGNPHNSAFLVTIDVLTNSPRGGVMRLLLSLLDDPHAPSAAISVISNRSDPKFMRYLLKKIGREPSAAAARNLKQIKSLAWLQQQDGFLDQFDDAAQHSAVQLVMKSGVPRLQAFSAVGYLLKHGSPGGRRAAAAALAKFTGTEANALALEALEDTDPQVQANVISQLRGRGIPGVLPRLFEMIDSPHEVVRNAVRESLEEFTFKRFAGTFDMLDDEVRRNTGMLVKKVDPQTVPLLKKEMQSKLRTRRLRGLAIARTIEVVAQLEEAIIGLLRDEDHLVRVEAATALALAASQESHRALEEAALCDRSEMVCQAAQRSLQQRGQSTRWHQVFSE